MVSLPKFLLQNNMAFKKVVIILYSKNVIYNTEKKVSRLILCYLGCKN